MAADAAAFPPILLRALRDRSAALAPDLGDAGAHAQAMLRGRVLETLSHALSPEGLRALLVKGAALAMTVYPTPAARPMKDIDLLVPARAKAHVLAALAREGGEIHRARERPWSEDLLGEIAVTMRCGATPFLVEVHTTLDKIVARPIDTDDLFARATPALGLPGLLVPSLEDHALLVALHAAGNELRDPIGLLDLELLLRAGLDLGELAARAAQRKLETVMYIAMATLRALGAASITDAHVDAFAPGLLRRAALSPFYDVGAFPIAKGPFSLGLRWLVRQTPLRDDLGPWARGLARYAAVRAAERLLAASPFRTAGP
jgi:hypothetical protein